nr:hypothetical protein [Candidatus Woesearchaeota archaeon]
MTDFPRKYIDSGDYMSAFTRVSADLEQILFEKLFFERGFKLEQMERWTLSKFVQQNLQLGLIDKKWIPLLNEFRELRNKVIHRRVFLLRLVQNPEELEHARKLLYAMCDFIDKTWVVYKSTPELEKEYSGLDR